MSQNEVEESDEEFKNPIRKNRIRVRLGLGPNPVTMDNRTFSCSYCLIVLCWACWASFRIDLKMVKNVQVLFLFVQTCMVIKVTLAMLRRVKF